MTDPVGVDLDLDSPVPPFEQLRARIADLVRRGVLAPRDRLPSVRTLAADLGIAPNTVVRAYDALELAGLVQKEGRRGTVVAEAPPPPDHAEVEASLRSAVALARAAGWDAERVRRSVDGALGGVVSG